MISESEALRILIRKVLHLDHDSDKLRAFAESPAEKPAPITVEDLYNTMLAQVPERLMTCEVSGIIWNCAKEAMRLLGGAR
jgi:hypothetical protein